MHFNSCIYRPRCSSGVKQLAEAIIYSLAFQELCDATVADALAVNLWHDLGTKQPHLNLILCALEDIARGVAFIHSKNIIHGALPQCGVAPCE